MFEVGKKTAGTKLTLDDDRKRAISQGLAEMLEIQMAFSPAGPVEVSKIEVERGHINRKAIGYIYGFIDCALQSIGQEITDLPVGIPILFHVLRALFPGHEEAYVDFLLTHMKDEMVTLGMMVGGQQYAEYIVKPEAKGVPMGLARFIMEQSN